MTDDRRMTTDRFYGGVSNRLENLRAMLEYVRDSNPTRSQLNSWVISNTQAGSEDAVSHHLTFLESIELIELSETSCDLAECGEQWLNDQNPKILYEALSSGVKGFDTLLQALQKGPMTDEDIMNLLVSEFEEAEMTTLGPAIRHREWLQTLGFIKREDNSNRITAEGKNLARRVVTRQDNTKEESDKNSLDVAKTFSAEIDRISSNGYGIIELEQGHVNIGPIKRESVGKKIEATLVRGGFARCETEKVKVNNYYEKFAKIAHLPSKKQEPRIGDVIEVTVDQSPITFNEVGEWNGMPIRIQPHIHYYEDVDIELGVNLQVLITDREEDYAVGKISEVSESCSESWGNSELPTDTERVSCNDSANPQPAAEDIKKQSPQEDPTAVINEGSTEPKLNELRNKAEKNSTESVQKDTQATTEKSQYDRSPEVKEYVKARADGVCEGCSEPAPFTSKTGDPYLHAHHIHELSDGGSDTPDTVVALCPNCHYRVHHGKEGREYNQQLLEKVQEMENEGV